MRFLFAIVLLATAACAPSVTPSRPSGPPAALAPAPAPLVVDVDTPELPPVPVVADGPRAATELRVAVADEVSAEALGALAPAHEVGGVPRVVLTLEPCRFAPAETAESPSVPEPGAADHCRRANQVGFAARRAHALVVPPGTWELEVQNDAFDRALGLWLRREDDPTDTRISAGGIPAGESRSFTVTLEPGRYLYSCPLSPTADYVLIVR